mmetsp:Transcript_4140/g.9768  ORF Transcript_4140/g.9768 Transcript_4140/m.9768 type:complete len:483 (-) Transcript_4140:129-1577(-)
MAINKARNHRQSRKIFSLLQTKVTGDLPNIDLAIVAGRVERVGRPGADRPDGPVVALGVLVGQLDQEAEGRRTGSLQDGPDHDVAALQSRQEEGIALQVGAEGQADDALAVPLGEHALPVGGVPGLDGAVQAGAEDEGPLRTLEQDKVGDGPGMADALRLRLSRLLLRRLRLRLPSRRTLRRAGDQILALTGGQIPQPDRLVRAGRPQHVAPHDDQAGDLRRVAVQRLAQDEAALPAVAGLVELPRPDDAAVSPGDHGVVHGGEGGNGTGVRVRGMLRVHVQLEGRIGGIRQIPHVDHADLGGGEDLGRSLEAAEEVVGRHLQCFHLAAGHHAVLELLGEVGGRVPKAPVSVVGAGEDFNLAARFPYRHAGYRSQLVLVVLIIIVAILPVLPVVAVVPSAVLLLLVRHPAGRLQTHVELEGVREVAVGAMRTVVARGEVPAGLELGLLAVISSASSGRGVPSASSAAAAAAAFSAHFYSAHC